MMFPKFSRTIGLGLLALLLFGAGPVSGQSVRGRTIDGATGQPVAGVKVTLVRAGGGRVAEVVSNADGIFQLAARSTGDYRLETEHIAFTAVETAVFTLRDEEQIVVDVRLPVAAMTLEPLTIVARRPDPRQEATEDGFYARRLLSRPIGSSRVFLPHDPEMMSSGNALEVLNWVAARRPCTAVYWNGQLVMDSAVARMTLETPVANLEGVEYYRQPINAPMAFRDLPMYLGFENAYCSVVALWPRTGRYLAEPAPVQISPRPLRLYVAAAFNVVSGDQAPGGGPGLEVGAIAPFGERFALGITARGTTHTLDAASTAALTATASDLTYVLPPGDRGMQLWLLGLEPTYVLARRGTLRFTVSARVQGAQRNFTLLQTYTGNPSIGVMSRGWGVGAGAGVEAQVADRLSAMVKAGYDRFSFGPYDKLDREPAHTEADWSVAAVRLGLIYHISR